jgi:hypothetical protein
MPLRSPKPTDRPSSPRHRERPIAASNEDMLDPEEPPSLDTEPRSRDRFERAVGRAITSWQEIEEALCEFFVEISTCQNPDIARAIYWTFRDFGDKLQMVRNGARLTLSEQNYNYFKLLRNRLISASEKRNAIAHYDILFYGDAAKASSDGYVEMEIRLTPNFRNPNLRFREGEKSAKPAWLNTVRIRNAATAFLRLARTIDWLKSEIRQPLMPPE